MTGTKNKISINFDITPFFMIKPVPFISSEQYARDRKRRKEHHCVAFPFIRCYNRRASLCFGMYTSDRVIETRCIDETAIGLDNESLIAAIEFQGGTINQNDGYAISPSIRNALFAHIDVVKELVGRAFKDEVMGYMPSNRPPLWIWIIDDSTNILTN